MADQNIDDVVGILDKLKELAESDHQVSVGEVTDAFGRRGYGPLLAVPALVGASPVGGIPTVPTILAVVIVIVAVQMVFGARSFWMPGFLSDRAVSSKKLGSAVERVRPWGKRLDRLFKDRLQVLTTMVFERIAAVCCVVLALIVPPLEFVPFAAAIPFIAILLFGIALAVHDGVVMLVAFASAAGAAYAAYTFFPSDTPSWFPF
ncbi:exopolysaccharide biosynthesis protein [Fulvimarina sp. MAC8]|uniref:exopolysaccharide biosynthesis protein n=1 Tax=Fulvimarina sp. MAC8 TaxID=3162874 RepID=UPI0032EB4EF2